MLRATLTRAAVVILAAAGLWIAWSQNPQPPATLKMEKVTDGLFVIMEDGGNVAVMPTAEGVLLVDDKFDRDGPQILSLVKSVSEKPIRYVMNTHQHGDHTGGNKWLQAWNAEILIHQNARANMAKGEMPGLPRVTFSNEAQVFLGGKEVVARYFGRGHTNGDAMIFFPSERVLHTGDLFTSGAPYCDTTANCSIKEWDATIKKALAYDFDKVIPGHGPVMTKADLAKYAQNVATARDRLAKACKSGPPEDAAKSVNLTDLWATPGTNFARGSAGMCKELAQ